MDIIKSYSRISFLIIFLIFILLMLLVDSAFYYGMDVIFSKMTITAKSDGSVPHVAELIDRITRLQYYLRAYFVPVSTGFFLLFALLLWLYLKNTLEKLVSQSASKSGKAKDLTVDQSAEEKKKKVQHDQRLFMHLLAVLQREGRFVDFLSEDLDLHEDSQIGAAVRNIHENCKKAIQKYIALQAVMDRNEGDEVTVEKGFDPEAIKLTGNVTGEPPFKGVLRHKGWKAVNIEIPGLASTDRPGMVCPAEVEILE
jgi:hypothetical protein